MAVTSQPWLLLPTKLLPPQQQATLVLREGLIARLNARPDARLTLLVAPAGFGKSTLTAQWLSSQPAGQAAPVAWLTLDEHDQNPIRVLTYIAGAIEQAAPHSLTTTLPLLRALETPPAYVVAQALLVDLSDLPHHLTLVLDDYHAVTAAAVHHIVAYLLRHLPSQCRLVLLSRIDPPLPVARLRAERQLTELRTADLRFTEAEAGELLAHLLGSPPAVGDVAVLHQQTEGWAIALQLAALAQKASPRAHELGAVRRQLLEYLTDEVFDQQPEELQRAMMAFAVPMRFCAELCAELLGSPDEVSRAGHLLDQLERGDLLLIPLDAQRAWFRFHHLFRELLLRRLRVTTNAQDVRALQLRAARWLAAAGQIDEAVRLYVAAGDEDAAGALVEQLLFRELGRDVGGGPPAYWLGLLPPQLRARRPGLSLIAARIAVVQMDVAASAAWIARVDELLAAPGAAGRPLPWPTFQGDLETLRGTVSYWQGRPAAAIEALTAGLQQAPVAALATSGLLFLGRAYVSAGRYAEGVRLIEGLPDTAVSAGIAASEAMRRTALCMIHELAGHAHDFHREAQSLGDTLAALQTKGSWATFAASYIGRAAYELSDLPAAARSFAEVRARKYQTNAYNYIGCLIGLALIALDEGAPEDAARYAEEAHAFAAEIGGQFLHNEALGCSLHLALARGDLAAALALAEQITPDAQLGARAWYAIAPPQLTKARALIVAGGARLAQAEALIDTLVAQVEAMHNMRPLVCALATRALLRQAQGSGEEALASLEDAVRLAAPRGLVRTIVDCGPALLPLLRGVAERGVAPDYARSLLRIVDASPPELGRRALDLPPVALPELLTRREAEILTLLGRRWSDKEIAERLMIAPNTVRKHTTTIYGKLGVASRREAVEVARNLGLLPSA